MHWCLATIDMDAKTIHFYDSMSGNNKAALREIFSYLHQEHCAKKGSELDSNEWKQQIVKKIPQQMNVSDCGMFTCKFAEYLSWRARFSFSHSDMLYFIQEEDGLRDFKECLIIFSRSLTVCIIINSL